MNTRPFVWKVFLALILFLLAGTILGCSTETGGPRAWIDFPTDGSSVPAGTPVAVLSHVAASDGVAEVLLAVNGQAYRRNPPAKPGEPLSSSSQDWIPQQEGEYIIEVTAYAKNGQASSPARARVRVIGKVAPTLPPRGVTPVISITPPLDGRTVTPVPQADLEIVSVQALYAGVKADVPFCNTRVVYRNAGTAAVPRDFTIQFHYNGTPQIANTVAGGLPAGATAEIIFVYQFQGSPYIGINLDSTSVITEISELNNAFAEARLCSGSTPATPLTFTPTFTPTPTRTPTIGIEPPPAGCRGNPIISSFGASPATITQGQSSTLSWGGVTNADSVSIDPGIGGVPAPGSRSVSPNSTTTYTLTARCGSNTLTRQTTLTVLPVVRIISPQPPKDTTAPPVPNPQSPSGTVACTGASGSTTLKWSGVSDPSGVTYYAKWSGGGQSGGWEGSGTQHGISIQCGRGYSWQVRACDGAGNCSAWSSSKTFTAGGVY